MDEMEVVYRARDFLANAGPLLIPVDVERLVLAAGAKLRIVHDLDSSESGLTFRQNGSHVIVVNGNHIEARRRFTVLHEVAHIVLGLPSRHSGQKGAGDGSTRGGRPTEEALCDLFAVECLLPYGPFGADVRSTKVSLEGVRQLAQRYAASITSTGSRFADKANEPCAFVFSVAGKIRSVARSKALVDAGGWIEPNAVLPEGSIACRLMRKESGAGGCAQVSVDTWFSGAIDGGSTVIEDSMVQDEWNQCLSLIWVKELLSSRDRDTRHDEEEELLPELDGVLRWGSRSRRR